MCSCSLFFLLLISFTSAEASIVCIEMLLNNSFMLQLCECQDMKHLGSLESTQKVIVAQSEPYVSFVLSKLRVLHIFGHTYAAS